MIKSGQKTEEYREMKQYWDDRLLIKSKFQPEPGRIGYDGFKVFDAVEFRNGYSKNAPRFMVEFIGTSIDKGNTQWGAEPGKIYWVIKLGKRINASEQKEPANAIA